MLNSGPRGSWLDNTDLENSAKPEYVAGIMLQV